MDTSWGKYHYKDPVSPKEFSSQITTCEPPGHQSKKVGVNRTHMVRLERTDMPDLIFFGNVDGPIPRKSPDEERKVEFVRPNGEVLAVPEKSVQEIEEIKRKEELLRIRKQTFIKLCSNNEYIRVVRQQNSKTSTGKLHLDHEDSMLFFTYDSDPHTAYEVDEDILLMDFYLQKAPLTNRLTMPPKEQTLFTKKNRSASQINSAEKDMNDELLEYNMPKNKTYSDLVDCYNIIDLTSTSTTQNVIEKIKVTLSYFTNSNIFKFANYKNVINRRNVDFNEKELSDFKLLIPKLNWMIEFNDDFQKQYSFSLLGRVEKNYKQDAATFFNKILANKKDVKSWKKAGQNFIKILETKKKILSSDSIKVKSDKDLKKPDNITPIKKIEELKKNENCYSDLLNTYNIIESKNDECKNEYLKNKKMIIESLKYFRHSSVISFEINGNSLSIDEIIQYIPKVDHAKMPELGQIIKKLNYLIKIDDRFKQELGYSFIGEVPSDHKQEIASFIQKHLSNTSPYYYEGYANNFIARIKNKTAKRENIFQKIGNVATSGYKKICSWFKKNR